MTSWSYSHYSLALACLRKYKHIVVDRLVPEGPESADLGFGTALHQGINDILTGKDAIPLFINTWDAMDGTMVYGRFKHDYLRDVGVKFLSTFAKKYASLYIPHTMEKRLYANYDGLKLEGTSDYIGLYDGVETILDFKTSATNYPEEKGPIALQLYLYAYLAREELGYIPRQLGYVVFNKALGTVQKPILWEYDARGMDEHIDNMHTYTMVFTGPDNYNYPKNANNCLSYNKPCEFFNKCWPRATEEKKDE